ncbi:uncharacterized protein LOC117121078 [Anneissia japonica]|uniref:uncharacterized protein LOC117121078 n=1 Tax=Anneissia japonica TaxID=1529436 RepID=UPI0014254E29|nr:uncharacterized protein LOC117121078 [Anneissia japonica]
MVRLTSEIDFPEKGLNSQPQLSIEDKMFVSKVKQTISKEDKHYCIGLPFRSNAVMLPNNKVMAEKRLVQLRKRLEKDVKFHMDYAAFMRNLLEKGYAEEVTGGDYKEGKSLYIPHHGVYHPQKKKIRVVFDCAAKYQGIALNDMLLPGPNLTSSLLGVLLRFREYEVALMADVEVMFHQVLVPEKDRNFLRFLWFPEGDLQAKPVEYRMRVHLFGAACANSALLQAAEDGKDVSNHKAVETLKRNFYVDDLLKSVRCSDEGIQLVTDLMNVCAKGGFNLTKWSSNDKQVIEWIPREKRSKDLQDLNLKEDGLPPERALGVKWSPQDDFLCFSPPTREQLWTKRGLLSILISSVFDPIGLVAQVILPARVVLQETIKGHSGWDDIVPENLLKRWRQWWYDLPLIEELKIPRWLGMSPNHNSQLHASERGYGVVMYLRTEGAINCNILYSRSRVAPLKRQTIPRLELTAATLAVKSVDLISTEMDVKFSNVYYWTDCSGFELYQQH